MTPLRIFLIVSTVLIYAVTGIASANHGINWPAVALGDLMALNWRSQFDTDFVVYLLLGATWISWREGFTFQGHLYAFFSVFLGGMFTFPYLLVATYRTNGDPIAMLLESMQTGFQPVDNNMLHRVALVAALEITFAHGNKLQNK